MITISLCMIVKNEERILARCLDSVKDIVDEIIIVDTGSVDKTKDIALRYTSNVFDFEWVDDFSKARNYSFSKASMDYILWLDADDIILDRDKQKLIYLKETISKEIDAVIMNYNIWVDENDNAITSIRRERLIKREKEFRWIEAVHEILDISGNTIDSDICITHKPEHENNTRNIEIYKKMISSGQELSPRSIFYYGEELFGAQKFDESIIYFNNFLAIENQPKSFYVTACQRLSTCYKIKKDTHRSIKELYRSFEYDIPHPYICFQLGGIYKKLEEYNKSIFWYELGLSINNEDSSSEILKNQLLNYNPCLNLTFCYRQIGNYKKSQYYYKKVENFKTPPEIF